MAANYIAFHAEEEEAACGRPIEMLSNEANRLDAAAANRGGRETEEATEPGCPVGVTFANCLARRRQDAIHGQSVRLKTIKKERKKLERRQTANAGAWRT